MKFQLAVSSKPRFDTASDLANHVARSHDQNLNKVPFSRETDQKQSIEKTMIKQVVCKSP